MPAPSSRGEDLPSRWPDAARWAFAVGVVALALGITRLIARADPMGTSLFLLAVTVAGWYAGTGPALLATALSVLAIDFFLTAPIGRLVPDITYLPRLVSFAAVAALTSWMSAKVRNANEVLRTRSSELEAVFRALPDLYFRLDRQGTIQEFYAGRSSDLYAPPEEFLGKRFGDVLPADVAGKLEEAIDAAGTAGFVTTVEYSLPVGGVAKEFEARVTAARGSQVVVVVRDVTERKRAEDALRESEERYRRLVELSPDAIVVHQEGRVVYINPAGVRLLGAQGPGEIVGMPVLDLVHPASVPVVKERIQRMLARPGERAVVVDERFLRSDGSVVDVGVTAVAMTFEGRPAIQVIARDITERKRAEEMIRQERAFLREVLDATPSMVFVKDWEGRFVLVNEALARCYGTSIEGIVGKTDADLNADAEEVAHFRRDDREVMSTRRDKVIPAEPVTCADGQTRWFSTNKVPLLNDDGTCSRLLGVAVDITKRKRAEDRLGFLAEASRVLASSLGYEETLQRVAQLALPRVADYSMVDMLSEDGAAQRVAALHADPEKQGLMDALRSHPPDPRRTAGVYPVLRTGRPEVAPEISDEMLQRIAGDDADHLRILRAIAPRSHIIVPLVARGRTLGAITLGWTTPGRCFGVEDLPLAEEIGRRAGLAIDNARLYLAEQEARAEAEAANQAKDQFVAMVSHELRNPLNATTAGLFLLRQGLPKEPRLQRAMEVVERNVTLQARLVNDLLDLSRLRWGKLQIERAPVALDQVVARACDSYQSEVEGAGLTLACEVEPDLWVQGDFDRLQQVLTNLLANAVKFTPAPGEVRVTCSLQNTGRARIVVADTGIGLDRAILAHLFEMFRQGDAPGQRKPGLGIGLALVKGIVERHEGRVWAESEGPGQGSRFIIELPLVVPPSGGSG